MLGALHRLDPAGRAAAAAGGADGSRLGGARPRAALLREQGVTGVDDAMRPAGAGRASRRSRVAGDGRAAVLAARVHRDRQGHHRDRAGGARRAAHGRQLRRRWRAKGSSTASPSTASCPTSSSRTATRAATAKAGPATRSATRSISGPTCAAPSAWRSTGKTPAAASSSSRTRRSRISTARYTVFGHVVNGMEVVDRIVPWDVVRRVQIRDGVTSGLDRQLATPRDAGSWESAAFARRALSLLRRLLLRALSCFLRHVNPPLRRWSGLRVFAAAPGALCRLARRPGCWRSRLVGSLADARGVGRAATRGQKKWGAPSSTP